MQITTASIAPFIGNGQQQKQTEVPFILTILMALMGPFSFGYNLAIINTGARTGKEVFDLNTTHWSIVVSVFCAGGVAGALLGGHCCRRFGRKKTMLLLAVIIMFGNLLQVLATKFGTLVVGRLICGIASGGYCVVVPIYLAEICFNFKRRGPVGTLFQVSITIGILAASFANNWRDGKPEQVWRLIIGLALIPPFLLLVFQHYLLESPRWLIMQQRPTQAKAVLEKLRGGNDVSLDLLCMGEQESMGRNAQVDKGSIRSVLTDRTLHPQMIVGVALQVGQQMCGINAIMYYSVSFLTQRGMTHTDLLTVLAASTNAGVAILVVWVITRKGRRFLLLVSSCGMLVAQILLAIFLSLDEHNDQAISTSALTGWSATMILLAVGFFEFGLGTIPWLVMAEIFPASQRTAGVTVCAATNWLFSFFVGLAFPHMDDAMGGAVGVPFILFLVMLVVFILKYVRETGDKSLEAIQEEYTHLRANEKKLSDGAGNENVGGNLIASPTSQSSQSSSLSNSYNSMDG